MATVRRSNQDPTSAESIPENEDWTELFNGEGSQVVLNVKRLEPSIYQGQQVGGYLGGMTIDPIDMHRLPDLLIGKWGGGLYSVQNMRRGENGKLAYDRSIRIRCVGTPKLDIGSPATAPVNAPAAMQAAPQWYQPPQPYPQPQQQQQPNAGQMLAELPRLLAGLAEIVRMQHPPAMPGAAAPPQDVVGLIGALRQTLQPEDDFAKFERFIRLQKAMQNGGASDGGLSLGAVDWSGVGTVVREFFRRPAPAPAPVQPQIAASPVIPAPPGWRWTGQGWARLANAAYTVSPTGETIPPADGASEEGEEDEGEDEVEDEEESPPMTAEELAAEWQRMAPDERAKIEALARGI